MPQQIIWNEYQAGWCPSDDPIKGRKNVLFQMDNLELDSNGTLQLCGGIHYTGVNYSVNSPAIRLDNRTVGGTNHTYGVQADGTIKRDNLTIATASGATPRAAFSSAFDYEIICAGDKRIKDNGAVTSQLGVGAPTVAITFAPNTANNTVALPVAAGLDIATNVYIADGYSPPGTPNPQCDFSVGSLSGINALKMKAIAPVCVLQSYNLPNQPVNWSVFPDGTAAAGSDYMEIRVGGWPSATPLKSIRIDFLLSAPTTMIYGTAPNTWTGAPPVTDYYSATFNYADIAITPNGDGTESGVIKLQRSQFSLVGTGSWSAVFGWKLIMIPASGGVNVDIVGPGDITYPGGFSFYRNISAPSGYYQYIQRNVNSTGAYQALSPLGPISTTVHVVNEWVNFIYQDPTAIDPQVNEVWIYRRNSGDINLTNPGMLDQWYKVAILNKVGGVWDTNQRDMMSDQDALTLDQTIDLNLVSVQSITDPILDIVGPIEGRWFYFTKNFMYPSDINDPDLLNPSLAVRTAGTSEVFQWARAVSDAIVLVGTSNEIYVLTGTFRTLPDYTVDIYYHGLGCKFPPVSPAADVYSSVVFYLSSDGWRSYNASGNNTFMVSGSQIMPYGTNPLWVSPNIDVLYRGGAVLGYYPVNYNSPYNCITIAKNKLWCAVVGSDNTTRIDVYDFIRQYWRPYKPTTVDLVTAMTTMTNGGILGALYNQGSSDQLFELDYDGVPDYVLPISAQFLTGDGGVPKQRKDSETLKVRCNTGNQNLTITVQRDTGLPVVLPLVATTTNKIEDLFVDISSILGICKTYQVTITGIFSSFKLEDIEVYFDLRPPQINFIRVLANNYGTTAPKRVYLQPFVADLMGATLTVTPVVDNVAQPPQTFYGTSKTSYQVSFGEVGVTKDTLLGVDYEYILHSPQLFEFYGMGDAKTIEAYPERQLGLKIPTTNFGTPSYKRIRVWPFVIHTWRTAATFTPIVGGVIRTDLAQIFVTTEKTTVFVEFPITTVAIDYSGYWSAPLLSVYEIGKPEMETYTVYQSNYQLSVDNFGTPSYKRVRVWPFVINAWGYGVTFTPIIDGISHPELMQSFVNSEKKTIFVEFPASAVGIDFSGVWSGIIFSILEIGKPEMEVYPVYQTTYQLPVTNFGIPQKKRLRVWPFTVNTWGSPATFTPIVDGVAYPELAQTFTTSENKSIFVFYTIDVFGVDYSGTWTGPKPFSITTIGLPDVVQVLPIARRFDQVGPEELFRYGRINKMEIRVLPFGVGVFSILPFTIYFNDNSVYSSTVDITNNSEACYIIGMPKGTSGTVVRVVIGPTDYDFHRFYIRLQVFKTGKDTELEWVTLPIPQETK